VNLACRLARDVAHQCHGLANARKQKGDSAPMKRAAFSPVGRSTVARGFSPWTVALHFNRPAGRTKDSAPVSRMRSNTINRTSRSARRFTVSAGPRRGGEIMLSCLLSFLAIAKGLCSASSPLPHAAACDRPRRVFNPKSDQPFTSRSDVKGIRNHILERSFP
jgi:hypothetical protein